jgi:hypothetical protein
MKQKCGRNSQSPQCRHAGTRPHTKRVISGKSGSIITGRMSACVNIPHSREIVNVSQISIKISAGTVWEVHCCPAALDRPLLPSSGFNAYIFTILYFEQNASMPNPDDDGCTHVHNIHNMGGGLEAELRPGQFWIFHQNHPRLSLNLDDFFKITLTCFIIRLVREHAT